MKIKVCGMREAQNIAEVAELAPDYMGFIFYEGSPRFVGEMPRETLCTLPEDICKVGVFVNASYDRICRNMEKYALDAVQLHGNEPPDVCQRLKEKGVEIIKSFNVSNKKDLDFVEKYANVCDYFLFDAKTSQYGGSGRKFNWEILQHYHAETPFFLSGGIAPEDIESILSFRHPSFHAIDLNSRFEISPGIKDILKLKSFMQLIRQNE